MSAFSVLTAYFKYLNVFDPVQINDIFWSIEYIEGFWTLINLQLFSDENLNLWSLFVQDGIPGHGLLKQE